MAKRWTEKEDRFIHEYFDAVGDGIGPRDLKRPAGAATKRAAHLRATGAWEALTRADEAMAEYRRCLGMPGTFEETMEDEYHG